MQNCNILRKLINFIEFCAKNMGLVYGQRKLFVNNAKSWALAIRRIGHQSERKRRSASAMATSLMLA